ALRTGLSRLLDDLLAFRRSESRAAMAEAWRRAWRKMGLGEAYLPDLARLIAARPGGSAARFAERALGEGALALSAMTAAVDRLPLQPPWAFRSEAFLPSVFAPRSSS